MMEIPTIEKPIEEAKKEYEHYSNLVKKRKEKELELLKKCNYHLKQGRRLVDIYQAIKSCGLNDDGDPNIAIARADWKFTCFTKQRYGTGVFSSEAKSSMGGIFRDMGERREDVLLPLKLFDKEWENQYANDPERLRWDDFIPVRATIQTPVPIIPAILRPDSKLENYYVLFEVDGWTEIFQSGGERGKDPLLLRRLSSNLFVILASWDLSPLEKSVLDGAEIF